MAKAARRRAKWGATNFEIDQLVLLPVAGERATNEAHPTGMRSRVVYHEMPKIVQRPTHGCRKPCDMVHPFTQLC